MFPSVGGTRGNLEGLGHLLDGQAKAETKLFLRVGGGQGRWLKETGVNSGRMWSAKYSVRKS